MLTDIHVSLDPERRASWHNAYDFAGLAGRLRGAAELFAAEGTGLVLALGDLAHDGDAPSLEAALSPLASGPPLHVIGGNHDGARPTAALAALELDGVRLPGWRALRTMDAVRTAAVRVERRAARRWAAARPPAMATWGDEAVLLASHFPVLSRAAEVHARGLPYAGDLLDRPALAARLLARPAPTIVACGHLHVRESVASGALLQIACGALIEPPFEATILDLEAAAATRSASPGGHTSWARRRSAATRASRPLKRAGASARAAAGGDPGQDLEGDALRCQRRDAGLVVGRADLDDVRRAQV